MRSGILSIKPEVLLKTAIAPISSDQRNFVDGNILLDDGAKRSFISEDFATKLGTNASKTEKIATTGFGDNGSSMRHLQCARIYVKGDMREIIPIDVLIVSKIGNPVRTFGNESLGFEYIERLKLAHQTTRDKDFDISLLIGADYYWNLIEDQVIRGNGPTAVKSKLGFLLSGPTHARQNVKK